MGGKSSSKSSSSTSTTQIDGRIAATDDATVTRVNGNNNTTSDFGAIEQAGLLALEAIKSQNDITIEALSQSRGALDTAGKNADKVFEFVDDQNQNEGSRTFQQMLPYLLAGVSVLAFTGKLKVFK